MRPTTSGSQPLHRCCAQAGCCRPSAIPCLRRSSSTDDPALLLLQVLLHYMKQILHARINIRYHAVRVLEGLRPGSDGSIGSMMSMAAGQVLDVVAAVERGGRGRGTARSQLRRAFA